MWDQSSSVMYAVTNGVSPSAEFDALVRLGIPDPPSYIKKRFKSSKLLFLRAACVGQTLVDQVEASVEEAVSSSTWTDIQVPTQFFLYLFLHQLLFIEKYEFLVISILTLILAVVANFAQLPVNGGCWNVDQPGHEKH